MKWRLPPTHKLSITVPSSCFNEINEKLKKEKSKHSNYTIWWNIFEKFIQVDSIWTDCQNFECWFLSRNKIGVVCLSLLNYLLLHQFILEQIVHFIFCMEGLRGQGTILIHDTEAKKHLEISFSFAFEKKSKSEN